LGDLGVSAGYVLLSGLRWLLAELLGGASGKMIAKWYVVVIVIAAFLHMCRGVGS
jgi:hypothetical protein